MKKHNKMLIFAVGIFAATPAIADQVEIVAATAHPAGSAGYRFDVTLRHGDTGWQHYADLWQVELANGTVLAQRVLLHPHVNEQPFTRSQGGVIVPAGVSRVFIRARDKQHGWAAKRFEVRLDP